MTEWQYFCMLMREEPSGTLVYFAAIGIVLWYVGACLWCWFDNITGGKDGAQPE
jgi:hypothetical protein